MNDELRALLDRLQREIRASHPSDPESREALRELEQDIHRLLQNPEDGQGNLTGLPGRLGEAVTRFETTHPDLAQAINRVINALNAIGL